MSAVPAVTADPHAEQGTQAGLEARVARFPARQVQLASQRVVSYREADGGSHGDALPLVLLHGIGSGAASWVQQFEALGATRRVLAWDAPGYGASTPVEAASPCAGDYAAVLREWLDALGIERCVLLGHSLGAIVAGAFCASSGSSGSAGLAVAQLERVAGLLLLSPAGGYGAAPAELRDAKRDQRLAMLRDLGPQGLAGQRSGNMVSAHASDEARAWVRWNMSRVIPQGYEQATHLLANADLAADLARYRAGFQARVQAQLQARNAAPIAIAVGAEDTITPPAACEHLAQAAGVPLQIVPRAGHAGYIEAPAAYTAIIDTFCRASDEHRSQ
ncbi:alpha/beta hydrolase [Paraburkholderia sp. D15]|uniref:alpha/beta fold hydrolase n=1 Tax=Paraburkholderia sp. D15 TaxID=2880218 RepID=UPI0024783748|nr:alpha/beta hydrolase [Paraburkholderia sp. D15]WGS51997.1 alpha/beta hydrolase [Paraburkholderia sp. D15]